MNSSKNPKRRKKDESGMTKAYQIRLKKLTLKIKMKTRLVRSNEFI